MVEQRLADGQSIDVSEDSCKQVLFWHIYVYLVHSFYNELKANLT